MAFLELTKPEISFLVALSAAAGFLLGSGPAVDLTLLLHTLLGTTVTAGGSGMLNHFVEYPLDGQMKRTLDRPLPTGRISPKTALAVGLTGAVAGTLYLYLFTNGLAAALAATTVGFYLLIYTPLKRVTKYNTLIGCIPGALPPLGGWVAATGTIDPHAWIMFGVLFAWQMPHFLALAWMYRNDYDRAGFVMLPVVEPDGISTARQTIGFTVGTFGLSLLPYVTDLTGWLYLIGTIGLGVYFLVPTIRFYVNRTNQNARHVLKASVVYIPALLALITLDRLF
jgi:protoheme IX farnesyltransferase